MKRKIIGMMFPINNIIFKNLLRKKEAVFSKFMPHQSIPYKLEIGSKLFFYLSNVGRIVIGESKIKKIELLSPKEIKDLYKSKLLIKIKDFNDYVGERVDKILLVLSIENIKIYNKPVKLNYSVTIGGKYIDNIEYNLWKKLP